MSTTLEFSFKNHGCTLIVPDNPAAGTPWLWRTEFLHAFDDADRALLERGWHIAFCSFSDEYGSPESIQLFKEFRDYIVKEYKLNDKAAVFGFSRGALYACNYALKYPGDVKCLYLDAPVIDLKSWPARCKGAENEWEDCRTRILHIENVNDTMPYGCNPADRLEELSSLGIPVLIVAGDSDTVVPYEENGALLENALKKNNADYKVIIKPGCDHHPHSLTDVSPIVAFCEK